VHRCLKAWAKVGAQRDFITDAHEYAQGKH